MRVHVNPRQVPLPRGGSTPSPPSLRQKLKRVNVFKMT